MKTCSVCLIKKEEDCFGVLGNRCKNCTSIYNKKYREDNAEKIRESKRLYSHTEQSKKYKKEWDAKNKERRRLRYKKYKESNPEKIKARATIYNKIKRTDIKKPCEVCGNISTEAHHDDYSKPLEVRWLCIEHHKEYHRKLKGVIENG